MEYRYFYMRNLPLDVVQLWRAYRVVEVAMEHNFTSGTCDHRKEVVLQKQSVRQEDVVLTLTTLLLPIWMRSSPLVQAGYRISGISFKIAKFLQLWDKNDLIMGHYTCRLLTRAVKSSFWRWQEQKITFPRFVHYLTTSDGYSLGSFSCSIQHSTE